MDITKRPDWRQETFTYYQGSIYQQVSHVIYQNLIYIVTSERGFGQGLFKGQEEVGATKHSCSRWKSVRNLYPHVSCSHDWYHFVDDDNLFYKQYWTLQRSNWAWWIGKDMPTRSKRNWTSCNTSIPSASCQGSLLLPAFIIPIECVHTHATRRDGRLDEMNRRWQVLERDKTQKYPEDNESFQVHMKFGQNSINKLLTTDAQNLLKPRHKCWSYFWRSIA